MRNRDEARYLIRLAHTATPAEQASLLQHVRDRLAPFRVQAMNLRVGSRAIEFDLFCDPSDDLHAFVEALAPLGKVLTQKRLDGPPPQAALDHFSAEARELFNEERYWEMHEVLENVWRASQGQEKSIAQGLILTAAALVHRQKNEESVVNRLLEDALRRLTPHPPVWRGWDLDRLVNDIVPAIRQRKNIFPTL